ncbi:MAG: helix-turn-helix transcriptional regulator [Anaerolineales bacterium]|nr:helix-turn-helix transcriptional regulator [Anaerolineales bacterium]
MIKSSVQLKCAEERLGSVRQLISEYNEKYSGIELELYSAPLIVEERQLLAEIVEYKKLKELPFVGAINYLHYQSLLIDNIGELLSKLRIAAKLSQSEMAQKLGWEQSNLSRFESENYNSQTINKIVEYASALGIWLHIFPSLSEDLEIRAEKRHDIEIKNVRSFDTVSTSLTTSSDITTSDVPIQKYVVSSAKQHILASDIEKQDLAST